MGQFKDAEFMSKCKQAGLTPASNRRCETNEEEFEELDDYDLEYANPRNSNSEGKSEPSADCCCPLLLLLLLPLLAGLYLLRENTDSPLLKPLMPILSRSVQKSSSKWKSAVPALIGLGWLWPTEEEATDITVGAVPEPESFPTEDVEPFNWWKLAKLTPFLIFPLWYWLGPETQFKQHDPTSANRGLSVSRENKPETHVPQQPAPPDT